MLRYISEHLDLWMCLSDIAYNNNKLIHTFQGCIRVSQRQQDVEHIINTQIYKFAV
jgi:hypothetical protein